MKAQHTGVLKRRSQQAKARNAEDGIAVILPTAID